MPQQISNLRKLVFSLTEGDPEVAHRLAIYYLRIIDKLTYVKRVRPPARPLTVMGLTFPSPVGLAAGFNKDASPIHRAVRNQHFGFQEVGTVVPLRQVGNPRPRIKRYPSIETLQNKMGFPSAGMRAVAARLRAYGLFPIPIGVNIGPNKSSVASLEHVCADLQALVTEFCGLADYLAVNVSSPNTPGLRALQGHAALTSILNETVRTATMQSQILRVHEPPILVKVAPDLTKNELTEVCGVALEAGVTGIIVANTTINYDLVSDNSFDHTFGGGVSGPLLFDKMVEMVHFVKTYFPTLTIIGVGGINSADRVKKTRDVGADLIEVYTAWVYGGSRKIKELSLAWWE